MNHTFPHRTRQYRVVFVVDLSSDLLTLNNLLLDCNVDSEDDQAALIEFAIRRVMATWGISSNKPQPSAIFITEKTLGRVRHYVDNSTKFKLHTLQQILQWAPSRTINDIVINEGAVYFCYEE